VNDERKEGEVDEVEEGMEGWEVGEGTDDPDPLHQPSPTKSMTPGRQRRKAIIEDLIKVLDDWCKEGCPGSRTRVLNAYKKVNTSLATGHCQLQIR